MKIIGQSPPASNTIPSPVPIPPRKMFYLLEGFSYKKFDKFIEVVDILLIFKFKM